MIPRWAILVTALFGIALMLVGIVFFCLEMLGEVAPAAGEVEAPFVKLKATAPLLAVALGAAIAFFPARSVRSRSERGQAKRRTSELEPTEPIENLWFSLSSLEVSVDLRNRRDIGLLGHFAGEVSRTRKTLRAVVKEADPRLREISFNFATQGHAIELAEATAGTRFRVCTPDAAPIYSPEIDALEGQDRFSDLLKKRGRMDRSYYVTVPIAGPGAQIEFSLDYLSGYQASRSDWAGNIFIADTDEFSLSVVFPDAKRPRDWCVRKGSATRTDEFEEVADPKVDSLEDGRILRLGLRNARKGEAYVLRWSWA